MQQNERCQRTVDAEYSGGRYLTGDMQDGNAANGRSPRSRRKAGCCLTRSSWWGKPVCDHVSLLGRQVLREHRRGEG
jgi:hypothetical protein